jgi:preprotein translocase subunit SecG
MYLVVGIILILVCVVLGFLVLIQNPKGGGLAGGIGGLGQQMMGVQGSTDTVEKGTWIFAAAMGALCLITVFFNAGKGGNTEKARSIDAVKGAKVEAVAPPAAAPEQAMPAQQGPPTAAPANAAPATTTPANAAPPATKK